VSEYRVKQFFAVVNLAVELFEAAGGHQSSNNSLELTLDEYLEMTARVGDAKLQAAAATSPPYTDEKL